MLSNLRQGIKDLARELAEMAKEHSESALLTLVEIARGDGAPSARVSAAVAILDRAFGKPAQAVAHSVKPEDPLKRLLDEISVNAIRPVEHP